ncbi:MAG: hypothetical protein MUE63_01895 [Xanthomonadales bacterium]|nr:hypothetical protein [Xanthomonadales bacterium]
MFPPTVATFLICSGHVLEPEIPDIDQGLDSEQQAAGVQPMHETAAGHDQGAAVVGLQQRQQLRFIFGREVLFKACQ